jgi:gamma-glutamyltranspeptidase
VAGDEVMLEGHVPERWRDGLIARGHRVVRRHPFQEEFGHAQVIVSAGDHLAGASDPRSGTWAAAPL